MARAREIFTAFPGLLRWNDVATIDERDLNAWYREARLQNLEAQRCRMLENYMIAHDLEQAKRQLERIDFAIDQITGRKISETEQRAALESLKEVFA